MVKDSGLRGRGGAGFPTGMKWGFIPQDNPNPKYLVVNADESEPGTCKDIPLMMASPHTLVEGVIISSYAIRANTAFIYVRGEVLHVIRRLQRAVQEAYLAGHLGKDIHGSGYDLDLVVHAGAGAYICGEETALLDSLEGRRGQPRLRPPFPAVAGLYASPTVINNVESIASVPSIIANGADWFSSMGTERSKGYGIFSLSGHVTRPGQYEAPLGITLRTLIDLAGGMREGHELEVLDAGRLLDAAADGRAPRRTPRLRSRRRGRVDARHPRHPALRRDHVRRARRPSLDGVLQARVLRQVHAVPRGHLVAGADAVEIEHGGGTPEGIEADLEQLPPPERRHPGPVVPRPRRRGDEPDLVVDPVLPRGVPRSTPAIGELPVRPRCRHLFAPWEPAAMTDHPRRPTWSRSPSTASRSVPKGTLVIRAAEQVGIQIPRFCDHPLLAPVGAWRRRLVEVAMPGPDGSLKQMQGPPGRTSRRPPAR